jgi:hypothetical protein
MHLQRAAEKKIVFGVKCTGTGKYNGRHWGKKTGWMMDNPDRGRLKRGTFEAASFFFKLRLESH